VCERACEVRGLGPGLGTGLGYQRGSGLGYRPGLPKGLYSSLRLDLDGSKPGCAA